MTPPHIIPWFMTVPNMYHDQPENVNVNAINMVYDRCGITIETHHHHHIKFGTLK